MNKHTLTLVVLPILLTSCSFWRAEEKPVDQLEGESVKVEANTYEESSNFYVSEIGFKVDYPKGWEIREVKGTDASFGGVNIYPKDSIQSDVRRIREQDITEQLITISVRTNLGTYSLTHEYFEDEDKISRFIKEFITKANVLNTEKRTIDGEQAIIVFEYSDSENSLKGKSAILLAKPVVEGPERSLAILIVINYSAKEDFYSPEIASMIMDSFKEWIIGTMYVRFLYEP